MACTPCRRRRGCTSHPGRGGIDLQEALHSSERLSGRRCSRLPTATSAGRSQCHDRPALRAFANESPADRARTLFFDVAEARAVAAEDLQITTTSSRGSQRPRIHGYSRRNNCARMGSSITSKCSYKHEHQKTRANQRASPTVWINPIGSIVSCRQIAKTCGDAPCPLS